MSGDAGLITARDPDTVRGIDVAYFSFQRVPTGKEPSGFSVTPPELAVEIVGQGQGWPKMLEKASEYLELGVDRVWIVNQQNQTVHVFRKDHEDSQRFIVGDILTDEAILPGFSVAVADIFKNA